MVVTTGAIVVVTAAATVAGGTIAGAIVVLRVVRTAVDRVLPKDVLRVNKNAETKR
jgi:hypothetical protein